MVPKWGKVDTRVTPTRARLFALKHFQNSDGRLWESEDWQKDLLLVIIFIRVFIVFMQYYIAIGTPT